MKEGVGEEVRASSEPVAAFLTVRWIQKRQKNKQNSPQKVYKIFAAFKKFAKCKAKKNWWTKNTLYFNKVKIF